MTTCFTDALGNEWDLTINMGAAERIERADFSAIITSRKVSFFNPDKDFLNSVITDMRCIALMIWCIIKPKADKLGILHHRVYDGEKQTSPDDAVYFEDMLGGDTLYAAKSAFWEACSVFFQQRGISLRPFMDTLKTIQAETLLAIGDMQPKLQEFVRKELQKLPTLVESELNGTHN